jgi:Carbohydrate family 9 binding domain-like
LADSPDPTNKLDPASALVSQVLERAFQSAGDPAAFPELIEAAALTPWTPSKLYVAVTDGAAADVRIDSSEISHQEYWAGRPLDDQTTLALSLLAESYCATPTGISLRKVKSRLSERKDEDIMGGIALEPGGPGRRRLATPVEVTEAQRRAVQARRNLLAMINRAQGQPILAQQMNAQIGGLLRNLPPDQAGNLLYSLARTHFAQGRWSDTRDLLEKLLGENPNHFIAAEAQRWLIQFYASSEARHREKLASVAGQGTLTPNISPQISSPSDRSRTGSDGSQDHLPTTARISFDQKAGAVGGVVSGVPWAQGAADRAKSLMQSAPLIWSEPQVQFALAAAQRALGNVKDAEKFYTTFSFGRDNGCWSDAARSERWVRDRKGIPPKPVVISQRTATPPRLDGVLDDGIWSGTPAITFEGPKQLQAEGWQTQLRLAHDQQFLYIAIACSSVDTEAVPALRPRSRDMDLASHDHVDFYFDLDRDYCTYYHLAVDDRGCAFEDCWGDRTWDPTWYIASQADDRGYRIEAAIPLAELTDTPPADGTVWAFNATRIIPGKGIMSWSRPTGVAPRPEAMGLLIFSDGATTAPPRNAIAN